MEAKHTQEPWKFGRTSQNAALILGGPSEKYVCDVSYDFVRIGVGFSDWTLQERKANADRIVAAVNACAGIPTEALESGVVVEMRLMLEMIIGAIEIGHANDINLHNAKQILSKLEPKQCPTNER